MNHAEFVDSIESICSMKDNLLHIMYKKRARGRGTSKAADICGSQAKYETEMVTVGSSRLKMVHKFGEAMKHICGLDRFGNSLKGLQLL